ncbi:MAG: hypothetical protein RRZ83_05690 [Alistipes sp.]
MSLNPMVDEINKIVYNLLVTEHAVNIPSVGSLRVERQPAKRISGSYILPPYYTVVFTSQAVGTALPDAIAAAAGCDAEAARDACDRWLAHIRLGDALAIVQVGVLRQQSFTIAPSFDKVLNPRGFAPLKTRSSSSHWLLWSVAAIAIACGVGVCGWVGYDYLMESRFFAEPEPVVEIATQVVPPKPLAVADSLTVAVCDTVAVVSADTPPVTKAAVPVAPAESLDAQDFVKGHYYAVLGVFSEEKNAQSAAKEALKNDATLSCGVYRFGRKYMVTIFWSEDADACAVFAQKYRNELPDVWCYKAK